MYLYTIGGGVRTKREGGSKTKTLRCINSGSTSITMYPSVAMVTETCSNKYTMNTNCYIANHFNVVCTIWINFWFLTSFMKTILYMYYDKELTHEINERLKMNHIALVIWLCATKTRYLKITNPQVKIFSASRHP